ncbi:hypothetical protein [Amycolatopsis sp. lyj-108]|uniref:hypothetical protein n=1 Tax=Amycolatopsis sp. lyj-108 TaxID=2789286 RepID=UPI00397AEF97
MIPGPGGETPRSRPPQRLLDRLLAKSPIALDGVSVTIAEVLRDRISVVLFPMTRSATTLGTFRGDREWQ